MKLDKPISVQVDRMSVTQTVNSVSITGRVTPNTKEIGIHSFPACRLVIEKEIR